MCCGYPNASEPPATWSTTLNRAPPLAKLLTRAMGVVIAVACRARRSPAARAEGEPRPAIGGTLPIAPQRNAAAHDALPADPLSPIAPLIDVTTGPPWLRAARRVSRTRSSVPALRPRPERGVGGGVHRADVCGRDTGVLEGEAHRAGKRLGMIRPCVHGHGGTGRGHAENAAVPAPAPSRARAERWDAPSPMTNPLRSASKGAT